MTELHNQAFSIAGVPVYWYGIIIALGIVLAVVCAWSREKRIGVPEETTLNLALLVLPVGLVCARAYYVIFSWESYAADWRSIFNIRQGGLAIYGGLLGGAVAVYVYARVKHISFARLADLFAPALALAQGVGRWGNFVNQEAFGIEVTNPALQFFPLAVFIEADQTFHYATFFYESVWCLFTCLVILVMERTGRIKRVGDGFLFYAMFYAAERAVVEGLRTDSLMWHNIRVSQLLSVFAVFLIVLVFGIRQLRASTHRVSALIGIAFAIILFLAMLACAVVGLTAWPYLLMFSALSLALGVSIELRLPSTYPYSA